jgi:hypothetical protein
MPIICDICEEPISKKNINGYIVFKCNYCIKSGCIECIETCSICKKDVCGFCSIEICPCCK